jgi:hypothetical protein
VLATLRQQMVERTRLKQRRGPQAPNVPLPSGKFARSANHKTLLAILIAVEDGPRIQPMYDADASDRVQHLIDFPIGEAARPATLDDPDDLLG